MNIIPSNLKWSGELTPLSPLSVENIIIHHIEATKASIFDIHQWHLSNGWLGCGYNEYIRKDGTVYIGRGDNQGAHCYGYNENSYGIACEGNYDVEKSMPIAQYQSLVERIKYHRSRFKNLKKIGGHREFLVTACPGRYFPLDKVKTAINTNMPVLRQGSRGESVTMLQIALKRKGYNISVDGDFGPATRAAVCDFQTKNYLRADGIVGTFTWTALL
jgi:N-acetyl-anhydromuramyl-L-alanine amidase AmpD